jgi:ABC-type transport system involved in Fe-S cluster assembly fused permease/ATPase subunit
MDKQTQKMHGVEIPRLITRGYSLTAGEIEILNEKARSMGDSSLSAAVRAIIRDWAVLNSQRVAITEEGRKALAAAEPENSTQK